MHTIRLHQPLHISTSIIMSSLALFVDDLSKPSTYIDRKYEVNEKLFFGWL